MSIHSATEAANPAPGLVSVMMPAYNGERFIGEAIESLRAQTYREWELIVVNDGSTDGTARIARAFGDGRITVIDQPNGGESVARNTALMHMRGEFVAFLDADDLYLPGHLETAVTVLGKDEQWDATYSDGFYCDESGRLIQTLSSRRIPPADGDIFEHVVRSSAMLGPPVCVVMRRAVIRDHDFQFDTGITIGPDWDFFVRFAEIGRFKYLPEPTCIYRLHGGNISTAVGAGKRLRDLARCRSKAIQLPRFGACSTAVRVSVFYDLVGNLLLGRRAEQNKAVGTEMFAQLPAKERSRLLRLMASKTILHNEDHRYVADWLSQSKRITAWDPRTFVVGVAYHLSPVLCRLLLAIRACGERDPRQLAPFADIQKHSTIRCERAHRPVS